MDIAHDIFRRKAVVPQRLSNYGFTRSADVYSYHTILPSSGFEVYINITEQGKISTAIIDPATNEPYTLHLVDSAAGSFVGNIKAEYEHILHEIADNCFEPNVFKNVQAKKLIDYVRNKYGDELEYLWTKFPDNAVWHRKDTGKWYGALLSVSTSKLGVVPGEMAEIIDLRIQPEYMSDLIDHKLYFPGWHMNKKNWYTMILDGSVSLDELYHRIDESYMLAKK